MNSHDNSALADPAYVSDLGGGLIRRWSTTEDQEKIAQCLGTVFRQSADAPLNPRVIDEIRIMMSPGYAFMGPGDIAIVVDTSQPGHPVVASTCCWSHCWSYGGIPFRVGRPELVATLPEYRNRGLMRALFAMFHARSTANGELVQAITGIPYYYRQFGYEYALDLDGYRAVAAADVPPPPEDGTEPYSLRQATVADIPDLLTLYNQERDRSLVWHETDATYWHSVITAWEDPVVQAKDIREVGLIGSLYMIVDKAGVACGYIWPAAKRRSNYLWIFGMQLRKQVNWQVAVPSLLRTLRTMGEQMPTFMPDAKPFDKIGFNLGRAHPLYAVLGEQLAPRGEPPYAWYLRVPDIGGFIRHVTPILEQRLADSILSGHTGELTINFYRGGLRLAFEDGRLATVEPWRAAPFGADPSVGCPALVFLQLLFGYRSLAELRAIFPDVYAEQEPAVLLDILFPKWPSVVENLSYT